VAIYTTQYVEALRWAATQCPGMPPFMVYGPTGIGKSEIPEMVAAEMQAAQARAVAENDPDPVARQPFGFKYLNFTACEYADLVGLPFKDGDTTVYCPPDWLKEIESFPRGIAVFDEVNRVEQQTRQAYMQILDRRAIGNIKIPKGWLIVQTANPTDEGYQVSDFDYALLRRSNVQELQGDLEFWLEWAQNKYRFKDEAMHPKVLAVAMRLTNRGLVRPVEQKLKPFPTFAGLVQTSQMLRCGLGALTKETRTNIYAGQIGAEAASLLEASLQNELLKELLEKALKKETIKASDEIMLDLSFLVLDHCRKSPAKSAEILHNFYRCMPQDHKPMFARSCYEWFTKFRQPYAEFKADWRAWCKEHMNLLKAALDPDPKAEDQE
jgi:hypothetical protein